MNIKTTVTHIFTKLQCQNKISTKVRPLYPRLLNLVGDNNYKYKNTILQPCMTKYLYPNLLYNTNIHLVNLKNRIQIAGLRYRHDPNFDIESFKKGVNQAMSVISKCIQENKGADRYLTWAALQNLKEQSAKWNYVVKSNIALEPDQIYRTHILNIYRNKFIDSTAYSIETLGLGYRPYSESVDHYVETVLIATFERLYSEHEKPEWNTTMFHVAKMTILPIK